MGKCKLCGRYMLLSNNDYGNNCLKKCFNYLGFNKYKNKQHELEELVCKFENKSNLTDTQKSILLDRRLAGQFLKDINLEYYKDIKNRIKEDTENISKVDNYSKLKSKELKLSDAYEIFKIYNKYKEVLISDEEVIMDVSQNLLWQAINFAFSRYYSKKKYLEGINQRLQYLAWKMAIFIMRKMDKPIAALLLEHSLNNIVDDMLVTEGIIVEKIKKDKKFKQLIENEINKSEKNKINSFNITKNINFEEGDLCWAFHAVNIDLSCERINDKWRILVTITDRYDFTDLKELKEYIDEKQSGLLLSTANNAAMISTSSGVLKPYDITIMFEL